MKLRWSAIPGLTFWGLQFLRNSAASRHNQTVLANYQLAAYSTQLTERMRIELNLSYCASSLGTLKIFETAKAMAGPRAMAERLAAYGLNFQPLDAAQTIEIEPQLSPIRERIAGSLRFPDDGCGDAHLFTRALAEKAKELGGEIRLSTRAIRLHRQTGRITAVETDKGIVPAETIILANGVSAPDLARPLGIRLPIAPAKGYSYTVSSVSLGNDAPHVPVIDDAMHAAVVPLGNRLRVVGTAEFAGRNTRIDPARIENLKRLLARLYPNLETRLDRVQGDAWAGLRPMSADGRPIIGASPVNGLWLNCGHGHLGWTKAAGSAKLLADLILGASTDLDPALFSYLRKS